MKFSRLALLLAFVLIAKVAFAEGDCRYVLFQETIDSSKTVRTLTEFDRETNVLFSDQHNGLAQFGQPFDSIGYTHSIVGLARPISQVYWIMLRLKLRNHRCDDIIVTMDSIRVDGWLDEFILIGPRDRRFDKLTSRLLEDGTFNLDIKERTGDSLTICESKLSILCQVDTPLDAEDEFAQSPLPSECTLYPNFPNPFNPNTTIAFGLPKSTFVQLDIFNSVGQHIKTLVSSMRPAGIYSEDWNGCDDRGNRVGSGIYFYRLKVEGTVETRKMILLK